jgi:hypothetical protein
MPEEDCDISEILVSMSVSEREFDWPEMPFTRLRLPWWPNKAKSLPLHVTRATRRRIPQLILRVVQDPSTLRDLACMCARGIDAAQCSVGSRISEAFTAALCKQSSKL